MILFNKKLIENAAQLGPIPQAHAEALHEWAGTIKSGSILKQKETAIRGQFIHRIFVEVLGYKGFGHTNTWTIQDEQAAGTGSADTALGYFSDHNRKITAPVELKAARIDLDAIMIGRHKSPVQQAWEYANDIPGCQFVIVSNMKEIRLYAVGHGRQNYETFNLSSIADSATEYARFRLLLGAENFLAGRTLDLLRASGEAEREITRKLYADYKILRHGLIISLLQANDSLSHRESLSYAQTILDRILFIAFAESRGLLSANTILNAFTSNNPYAPVSPWENFKGLFHKIDKGDLSMGIPGYNGGLFRSDPKLDALRVSDDICRQFKELARYDFASEISVNVLGHIFEQSVSDLERLMDAADTERFTLVADSVVKGLNDTSVSGRRKEEGVIYTPESITTFIVEQTLGGYLERHRSDILDTFLDPKQPTNEMGDAQYRKPTDIERKQKLLIGERRVEYFYLLAWREFLKSVKVLDPACGSGAFLVAAFDFLSAEYRLVDDQIQAITGKAELFDTNREILNGNLYGVDLNNESIEITKLSLWLKTAQYGKPLESLEANLQLGNSLIRGQEISERAFDWFEKFKDVFANGGFDVVIGNPPYVRMELIKPIKPYLEKHYEVAADRADLYYYFYELGLKLLKPGGCLGYISSSTFFKTGSGENLRRYLLANAQLRTLIDFGDLQVFEGVTTYPAIVVMDKKQDGAKVKDISFVNLEELPEPSLSAVFGRLAQQMPQSQLGTDSWQLEQPYNFALRQKIMRGRKTLKEVYGAPLYGIKTGFNEAFVVDRAARDALVREDDRSADLLKPFLEGKDLKKWRVEPQDLWLIYIPKGPVNIDDYPAIKKHLLPFKNKLEKRATKQAWFELQQAQAAYVEDFLRPKIIYPEMSQGSKFSTDTSGVYLSNKVFFLATQDQFLLALLNSKLIWNYLSGICSALRGGEWRLELRSQYIETIPIPDGSASTKNLTASLGKAAQELAEQRRNIQSLFRRRIPDLAVRSDSGVPASRGAIKFSEKLHEWWRLDFDGFRNEIKKCFKQEIPLRERNEWHDLFESEQKKVNALSAEIERAEFQIDTLVYSLFGLSPAEIHLIDPEKPKGLG